MRNTFFGVASLLMCVGSAHSSSEITQYSPEHYDICQQNCFAATYRSVDRVALSHLEHHNWIKKDAEKSVADWHFYQRYEKSYEAFASFLRECDGDCAKNVPSSLGKAEQLEIYTSRSILQSTIRHQFERLVTRRLQFVFDQKKQEI